MKNWIIPSIISTFCALNLYAQDNQWVARNNGLGNRTVYCIEMQANNPDVLVAGTAQGLFRTTNGGQQWNQMHNATARAVWISPNGQTIMFAFSQGSRSDGIWISRNGGQNFDVYQWMMWPYSLAVDPANNNRVFVGTRDQGFYYTLDGQNWNQANNGLPGGMISHLSLKNFNNQTHLFAATTRGVYHCIVGNNIQWNSIGPRNLRIGQTALGFDGDRDIFAGTNDESDSDGLYFSEDFGQNWDISRWCWWVQAVETAPGIVIFASREIGVLRSTDNGENWTLMNQQLPNFDVVDLAIHRGNNAVLVYCAHNGSGVYSYRIPVEGQPPSRFDLEEPDNGAEISIGPVIFRWGESEDPNGAVTYTLWLKKDNDSLSRATDDNLIEVNIARLGWDWARGDEVQWWVTAAQGGDITECNERFIFYAQTQPPQDFRLLEPVNGDTVENAEVLFRWEPSQDPDGEVSYIWLLDQPNGPPLVEVLDTTALIADLSGFFPGETTVWNALACSQGDTIWCEEQFRFHIKLREMPPEAFDLLHPANDTTINIADTTSDLITMNWQRSYDPNPEDTVSYCLYLYEIIGQIEVGHQFTLDDTIFSFRYHDYFPVRPGSFTLTHWYVVAISDEDTTYCNERFRFIAENPEFVNNNAGTNPNHYELLSVYPNPFNDRMSLTVELPDPGLISLEIIDLRGSVCACLARDDWMNIGKRRFEWDARGFPAGTYQARLALGEKIVVRNIVLLK